MRGKMFTTPAASAPTHRNKTHPQLQTSPAAAASNRWHSPATGATQHQLQDRRYSRQRQRPSGSARSLITSTTTSERHRSTVVSTSPQRSVPGAAVHHMLSELVDLSHSIAALLEQEALSPSPALTASARQEEAGLKTQEIERIVRRVESHFVDKIQSLEAANTTLKEEVQQLRKALQKQSVNGNAQGRAAHDVRGGLKEELEALNALDTAWSSNGGDGSQTGEAEQLRRVLLAEKRQRLRVEEQTQSLSEQHAKVVGTLERRLKKQEEQLYDLIAAIDRGYGSNGTGNSASVSGTSPVRPLERGTSHRMSTPRHLLRQQLFQHQETQKALQEYKENLRFESSSPNAQEGAAALEGDGLLEVRRTLESIRSSKPATVLPVCEPQILSATVVSTTPAPPQAAAPLVRVQASEVDEISSFLDNITKELESLDAE